MTRVKQAGITKAELARQLGVSRAYVTMLVNGQRKPSQEVVNKLHSLGVSSADMSLDFKPVAGYFVASRVGLTPIRSRHQKRFHSQKQAFLCPAKQVCSLVEPSASALYT